MPLLSLKIDRLIIKINTNFSLTKSFYNCFMIICRLEGKIMEYTIKQVSEKTNLSIYTLRYYDKEGLLPLIKRSESGIREIYR